MFVRFLILTAILLVGPALPETSGARADATWSNGGPVFRSDVIRRKRRLERERAARRRQYRSVYPAFMTGGPRPKITPAQPRIITLKREETQGTVIIDTRGRRLFYVLLGNRAYVYPISVGRRGFAWTGTKEISRIAAWPSWTPPAEMRRRQPGLPKTMTGGIRNPLGAKALYLGSLLYRIHGINNPKSIGRAASSGCFRMMNKHVVHLATLVEIGTEVRVVARYRGA